MNKIVEEKHITVGVCKYTCGSGDVIVTCGSTLRSVFDGLHRNHDNGGATGNCRLNGQLTSLKAALEYASKK